MTQEAKVKTQPENIQVHKPQPKTIAKQITHPQGKGKTVSVNKDHPFQMNVSGNIGKQTTIHGNVSTLTIQHVTTANVPQQIQPPIDVKSPLELSVHMPTTKVLTQSQLALNYRRRQRMRGKQTVNIQRAVNMQEIRVPVPVTQQDDGYFHCDKCNKKFTSKNYFRLHMRRLCEYLEHPEVIKCKVCGKLFRHEKSYKDHLGSHDGIRRFKCRKCGEKFLRESQLIKHRRDC